MKNLTMLDRYRKVTFGITTGLTIYAGLKRGVNFVHSGFAHELIIDPDYTYAEYDTARILAQRAVPSIGKRSSVTMHGDESEEEFSDREWAWLKFPGLMPVQAKIFGDGIKFRCLKPEPLAAILQLVEEHTQHEEESIQVDVGSTRTSIFGWDSKKSEWAHRRVRNSRSFGSIILPPDLERGIRSDLKGFIDSRERLQRLEIPWRRGYMLVGPPGTGKTSLSLAIAANLGFSLHTLSLTDIASDSDMRKAVSETGGRAVLVIEDIDAYSVANDRNHELGSSSKLSLSGILNALDGFETPDGLVLIATTNHVEHLDEALIRPGRLDRQFEVGYMGPLEVERLFSWFYECESPRAPGIVTEANLTPAQCTELFKQHFEDAEAGWHAMIDRVRPAALKAVA